MKDNNTYLGTQIDCIVESKSSHKLNLTQHAKVPAHDHNNQE